MKKRIEIKNGRIVELAGVFTAGELLQVLQMAERQERMLKKKRR